MSLNEEKMRTYEKSRGVFFIFAGAELGSSGAPEVGG
jgi:hypothetical protein